ncbi:nitroreductase family protein [Entamoeba histolytica HM-1:IMSS]|uniref:Nitroreductase family protein n=3 Tax=Entamoeba histolytica TaxID=5759 RepID=C4LSD2_ENTH1|nr:nitroreductase family protein [Entamoeba histolytica HM-1:IMSS]EAL50992.1 nitroreductase family protein [Entamoeba histolytica HM-1:IMSS]ENY61285.1 nitroreductase family protein, putative [Entamoeba histolytica HM-1:IMSS-A]|eukprot:XP_656375.1 nitroreductase family protein [Entamoeba histolytica HM-1:IMSS]
MDLFYDRRSVRSYTGEKISEEDIDKIVRAGFYAPTAVNKQETDHAIVVCANLKKAYTPEYWVCDASAATENILLAAHMLGYGAVWLGVYPEKDRMESIKKLLQLPEQVEILSIVSIGVSKVQPVNRPERFDATRLHNDKW